MFHLQIENYGVAADYMIQAISSSKYRLHNVSYISSSRGYMIQAGSSTYAQVLTMLLKLYPQVLTMLLKLYPQLLTMLLKLYLLKPL